GIRAILLCLARFFFGIGPFCFVWHGSSLESGHFALFGTVLHQNRAISLDLARFFIRIAPIFISH
ncbi:hypothetical protein, partial [Macrococcus epidermidis]|uniref:hypothetical protein n=1 Tax=Macrococcus epidermidis TaxID=1902580 RepID=UPI001A8FB492